MQSTTKEKTTSDKIVLKQTDTDIVAQPEKDFNIQSLISQALEQKTPVETLERLLVMRDKLKAEWAKEQFDSAMANFQAECPVIEKNKKVSFGTTNYSYAPLEVIVEQVKDILSKNGFSYTFDTSEDEKGVTIFCFAKHIAGHMEKSKCFIALDNVSKMNVSQKSGSAMTYGKRYAFCNAFGILTGDEDNDAQSMPKDQISQSPAYSQSTPKGYHNLYFCSEHDQTIGLVPAGVSKRTGNPYKAFYACSIRGCKNAILNADGLVVRQHPETGEMVVNDRTVQEPIIQVEVEETAVEKARRILGEKVPRK
jgi:YHS domain-containing protein